ncbi:olfactory receptor 1019-like [Trichosurus vulpecula]|uniref:olfactory receptor 1019-like n=1 Tax=Trichosurus vulpecula TaxID=9337 RepID=UPI00186AD7D1|nr:olfactory receptor 1019-like [Trichosurus vulpecula]
MKKGNRTSPMEFVFLGIIEGTTWEGPLFGVFLVIYSITVAGNLGLITLIRINPRLHTPMYFFLTNLSFLDFCYSSVTVPKMLADFLSEHKVIGFSACVAQMSLFVIFASAECYLLASMAYDRYVAICSPLLYSVTVSLKVCILLVIVCYVAGVINSVTLTTSTFLLDFCDSNIINSFFCDIPPLLALSCSDTHVCELLVFAFGGFIQMSSLCIIMVSYMFIIIAILRIRSTEGKRKAFSTCASHLTAVSLFYGTIIFMYLRPTSSYSLNQDRVVSVLYTVIIPMLNPIIYSLRNKEVKDTLCKVLASGLTQH